MLTESRETKDGWVERGIDLIKSKFGEFGIGQGKKTESSLDDIPQEVVETYVELSEKIENLIESVSKLFDGVDATEEQKKRIFGDIIRGLSSALYRTANQILCHGTKDRESSLNAFDEFSALIECVEKSVNNPQVLEKKSFRSSAIYRLKPPQNIEHRQIKSFDTLFSKEHIAWNISSESLYDMRGETKAGIRLDYNPLYKENKDGTIDKTKTRWVTSIDISGFNIDRVMNIYSERGHHFTDIFNYKTNLLMSGFAKAMERYFDKKSEESEGEG